MNGQSHSAEPSVEEWARTAQFGQPVRLGLVQAGVLAREPLSSGGMAWWMPVAEVAGWLLFGLVYVLGLGVPMVGALFVWLASRTAAGEPWVGLAQWIFIVAPVAAGALIVEIVRSRRRDSIEWLSGLLGLAASTFAFLHLPRQDLLDTYWASNPECCSPDCWR